jgi:hypothetical protein
MRSEQGSVAQRISADLSTSEVVFSAEILGEGQR